MFNNSNHASNQPSAGLFSNSQAPKIEKSQTDDMTQKINDIKDSDDNPTENEDKKCYICLYGEKKVVHYSVRTLLLLFALHKAIINKGKECSICKQKLTIFQRIHSGYL
jgi:hypothetical protein